MLCVMWLPNERTFYSFPSSLKCFTFLLVWKREKPSHPSTCVLLMRLNWKFAIKKCRLIFLKSFLPWDARSSSMLIPIGRSSQFDFVFVIHIIMFVHWLVSPQTRKVVCTTFRFSVCSTKREEKEKRFILTRNASLKAYANILPIGKSFVWSRN